MTSQASATEICDALQMSKWLGRCQNTDLRFSRFLLRRFLHALPLQIPEHASRFLVQQAELGKGWEIPGVRRRNLLVCCSRCTERDLHVKSQPPTSEAKKICTWVCFIGISSADLRASVKKSAAMETGVHIPKCLGFVREKSARP